MESKMPQDNSVAITIEEYFEYRGQYIGVCLSCGETRECCEPDADNYPCESCSESKVQGADNLLAMGLVE